MSRRRIPRRLRRKIAAMTAEERARYVEEHFPDVVKELRAAGLNAHLVDDPDHGLCIVLLDDDEL